MVRTSHKPVKPSLRQIADATGVARSTVSAILSRKPHCYASETTKARVLDTARRLNYRPNYLAAGLTGQQTFSIGFVVGSLGGSTVLLEQLDRLEDLSWNAGYRLIIAAHRDNAKRQRECVHEFLGYCVDGILIAPCDPIADSGQDIQKVIDEGLPVVTIGSPDSLSCPDVSIDREYGGYLQVRHLLETGRRRLAFVITGAASRGVQARIRGYRRALREFGLNFNDHLVSQVDSLTEHGKNLADPLPAAMELIAGVCCSDADFDGLVASSDILALGAMRRLGQMGRRVPEDVAVIGFDDERYSQALSVSLSTVRLPRNLSATAMQVLIRHIEARNTNTNAQPGQAPDNVLLRPELVIRESTGGTSAGIESKQS